MKTICNLYILILFLGITSALLLISDVVQFVQYDDINKCYIVGFEKDSVWHLVYWVFSRSIQSLSAPIIALILFWRPLLIVDAK